MAASSSQIPLQESASSMQHFSPFRHSKYLTASDGSSRANFYRRSAQRQRERAGSYDLEEIKQRFESAAKVYEAWAEDIERGFLGR